MLVIGFVSSSLAPIYVSIICSALAAIVLLVFSRLSKREVAPASAGGPAPLPGPAPLAGQASGSGTATATTATAVLDRPEEAEGVTVLPSTAEEEPLVAVADEPTASVAAIDASFPIADYDELTVAEILPLLPELDADELDEVRAREAAGKARGTILTRVDQLAESAEAEVGAVEVPPAPEPAPVAAPEPEPVAGAAGAAGELEFPIADYDDLKVADIL